MPGSKLVSRGTAYFAVISTLNLLIIMAAIANDGSVGNSTSAPTPTSIQLTTTSSKSLPSISSQVRGPGFESVIKVAAGGKESGILPTQQGLGKALPTGNTTPSLINFINSSSNNPFTTQNWTEVRAQFKSNALLPCQVRNAGDGVTVSWIRRKDYHLLTVGLQTYSSDDRFQAIHSQSPDDVSLLIKFVQLRDEGVYICLVGTHPPSSVFVTLKVQEVRAEIVGGPEKIYKAGSTVELKCDLIDSTEEPEYFWWYQGLQMINYDRSRHINVTHYKSSSVLILYNVQKQQQGNYSCVPSNAHPASIFVHIINGENPAAMQHGSHSTSCVPCPPLWFLSFLLSLALQAFYFRFMSNHVDRSERGHERRALCTITSESSPSSLENEVSSHTRDSQEFSDHCYHHQQPFHHNHHCHHLYLSWEKPGDRDTSSTHQISKNDHNHRPPVQDDPALTTHYECGESEKRCSVLCTCPPATAPLNINMIRRATRGTISTSYGPFIGVNGG
ncbi:uncharacterized protein LOC110843122 isoform X2 [Folsomia candida]|uniref:uncharacterized protein LOC110843122 isoform X2 n=1 Tax=Folsomia candida TaxID=158441 RepID=UPI001605114C|nr:uncharacterized protein LOC110843122 isoform X2 [Folsomia candida]